MPLISNAEELRGNTAPLSQRCLLKAGTPRRGRRGLPSPLFSKRYQLLSTPPCSYCCYLVSVLIRAQGQARVEGPTRTARAGQYGHWLGSEGSRGCSKLEAAPDYNPIACASSGSLNSKCSSGDHKALSNNSKLPVFCHRGHPRVSEISLAKGVMGESQTSEQRRQHKMLPAPQTCCLVLSETELFVCWSLHQ